MPNAISKAKEYRDAGLTYKQIAEKLNEAYLRTAQNKNFTANNVRMLLNRRTSKDPSTHRATAFHYHLTPDDVRILEGSKYKNQSTTSLLRWVIQRAFKNLDRVGDV